MTRPPQELLAYFLRMYRRGFFPMAEDRDAPLNWYYPKFRAIIPLDDQFYVPRRLRKTVRQDRFDVAIDRAFDDVVAGCAERDNTWINDDYKAVFAELHRLGIAHSVEARHDGRLVGGLYGLCLGSVFTGESMFSRETDASKVCLVHLAHRLRAREFDLLDSQIINDHTAQFGAFEVPQETYVLMLERALSRPRQFDGVIGPLEL